MESIDCKSDNMIAWAQAFLYIKLMNILLFGDIMQKYISTPEIKLTFVFRSWSPCINYLNKNVVLKILDEPTWFKDFHVQTSGLCCQMLESLRIFLLSKLNSIYSVMLKEMQ